LAYRLRSGFGAIDGEFQAEVDIGVFGWGGPIFGPDLPTLGVGGVPVYLAVEVTSCEGTGLGENVWTEDWSEDTEQFCSRRQLAVLAEAADAGVVICLLGITVADEEDSIPVIAVVQVDFHFGVGPGFGTFTSELGPPFGEGFEGSVDQVVDVGAFGHW
jgi:hypothetical protein